MSNCIYNHNQVDNSMFLCYECGYEFKTFSDLMFHRKKNHNMNNCSNFLENKCRFTNNSCWYEHPHNDNPRIPPKVNPTHNPDIVNEQTASKPSVFQDPPANLAPPSPQPTQAAWLKMVSMMNNLNQLTKQI